MSKLLIDNSLKRNSLRYYLYLQKDIVVVVIYGAEFFIHFTCIHKKKSNLKRLKDQSFHEKEIEESE